MASKAQEAKHESSKKEYRQILWGWPHRSLLGSFAEPFHRQQLKYAENLVPKFIKKLDKLDLTKEKRQPESKVPEDALE